VVPEPPDESGTASHAPETGAESFGAPEAVTPEVTTPEVTTPALDTTEVGTPVVIPPEVVTAAGSEPAVATGEAAAAQAAAQAATDTATRAARWAARRGRARRVMAIGAGVGVVAGMVIGLVVIATTGSKGSASSDSGKLAAAHPTTTQKSTTTKATTTTTTIPPLVQPAVTVLPDVPSDGLSWGSNGPVLAAYQRRLKQLHFDPGSVDGVYGQDTDYAVTAVEKLLGLPRDGRIGPAVKAGLEHFKYTAAKPRSDADRVEINLDTQVLTVFKHWQPILITTTSTGSGVHFCGGADGCQYAITPTGHYHFYYLHRGWDKGKLGNMWNPYYFNGGIAVHGLASVPSYPASHGCARIPMDIANYFPLLVSKGESVYVVGTAMKPGRGYVGPAPVTTTTKPAPTTTVPKKKHPKPPKGQHTTTTLPKTTTTPPKSTTTAPKTTTSHT
jgi:peptidoglycan hydrolase-like protein with peptidoglycan-binding domain